MIWYENSPIPVRAYRFNFTKGVTPEEDERYSPGMRRIVMEVDSKIDVGHYAIKFDLSANYFEMLGDPWQNPNNLDRTIYVTLWILDTSAGRSKRLTIPYGGARRIQMHERDPGYLNLKHPDFQASKSQRRTGGLLGILLLPTLFYFSAGRRRALERGNPD